MNINNHFPNHNHVSNSKYNPIRKLEYIPNANPKYNSNTSLVLKLILILTLTISPFIFLKLTLFLSLQLIIALTA